MDFRKMIVALAVGGAALGAGFTVAGAQTEPPTTTPPTTAPAAPDGDGNTRPDRKNCDKDGDGQPDERPDGATAENTFFRT